MAENVPDDDIKCRICLSDFTEPRLLDCFHVFCLPCLEHLIGENLKFKCPFCRTENLVPNGGVPGLAVYQTILKDTENKFCDICRNKKPAAVECLTCEDYLCTSCQDYHSKVKALQDHRYEVLSEEGHVIKEIERTEDKCFIHKKDLSLYCKPCNKPLCSECFETRHKQHDVKTITSVAEIEKDLWLSALYSLNARKHSFQRTLDKAKIEESEYVKNADIVKQEIKDHGNELKNILCKTVDIAMNTNIQQVNMTVKEQLKQIQNYIEETETRIISIESFMRTTERITKICSHSELLEKSPLFRRRFDEIINEDLKSVNVSDIIFETFEIKNETIKELAGAVKSVVAKEIKPNVLKLPIPNVNIVKSFTEKSTFNCNDVKDLDSGENDRIWVLDTSENCTEWDTTKETVKRSVSVEIESNAKLIRMEDGRILIFSGTSAEALDNSEKAEQLFEVPFEDGIACCLLEGGNLLVYNDTVKSLVEIEEKGKEVKRTIKNETLTSKLGPGLQVVCSRSSNLIFLNNNQLIITNANGDIINMSNTESDLSGICIDKYDNIFIGNISEKQVQLYTACGCYKRDVLPLHRFCCQTLLTFDGYGNLCVWDNFTQCICTYSYL